MRTLCKFCVFVSGRHCRYFEGKFRSIYCQPSYASDFKVKSTEFRWLRNSCTHVVSVSFLISSSLFSAVPVVSRRYSSPCSQANQRSLYSTKSVPPVHFVLRFKRSSYTYASQYSLGLILTEETLYSTITLLFL